MVFFTMKSKHVIELTIKVEASILGSLNLTIGINFAVIKLTIII